ncbi:MAG: RluA family pseudouridine synthase [Lentisphaerae bacterium]|nr:RluA family pseudouridine synthase [Lentisphaerota bacterium]MBT5609480.1 RluA family pseudouridine synthase [Lentisphaerota bacterium]MBT7057709.1 RluA family pseudouridine synthase [Lentisphaerota bacterium]MBT7848658.1 RluA family pseudouridine synthase [Lentisphaerota bacterium]
MPQEADRTPRAITTEHVVPENTTPDRLDRYVAGTLPEYPSKKSAYKAIKRGDIHVNGACVSPELRVQGGQCIQLLASAKPRQRVLQMSVTVVYEDDWLAVIVKPPDIPVSGNHRRTITRALPANLTPSPQPDAMPWPHPVHRLDGPTTGLLVVAKTRSAAANLGQQFETRRVRKTYYAIATGQMTGSGTIDDPLDGRTAETTYSVLKTVRSASHGWVSALTLSPHTGRTHQLRRHLALRNHPIVGDTQYGHAEHLSPGNRLLLCATGVVIDHPNTQTEMAFSIPPPKKFSAWLHHEEGARDDRATTDSSS